MAAATETKPKRAWVYRNGQKQEITGRNNPLGPPRSPLIQIGSTPNWNKPGHFDRT